MYRPCVPPCRKNPMITASPTVTHVILQKRALLDWRLLPSEMGARSCESADQSFFIGTFAWSVDFLPRLFREHCWRRGGGTSLRRHSNTTEGRRAAISERENDFSPQFACATAPALRLLANLSDDTSLKAPNYRR